jgi:hypothetical protein
MSIPWLLSDALRVSLEILATMKGQECHAPECQDLAKLRCQVERGGVTGGVQGF